jgi:hypothetical protein
MPTWAGEGRRVRPALPRSFEGASALAALRTTALDEKQDSSLGPPPHDLADPGAVVARNESGPRYSRKGRECGPFSLRESGSGWMEGPNWGPIYFESRLAGDDSRHRLLVSPIDSHPKGARH